MKVAIIVGVVSLSLVGLFLVFSKPSDSTASQNTDTSEVASSSFEADVASGTPLIDVRTAEEYKDGHVQGSLNLPLDNIKAGAVPDAEKQEKIYLYCRSGNRSAEAKTILEKSGYTNIVDLGGINDVLALGAKAVR